MSQTRSLRILLHPDLAGPETQALEKGHTVILMAPDITAYDLIMGPNCWRIHPALLKYLALAIKSARSDKKRVTHAT